MCQACWIYSDFITLGPSVRLKQPSIPDKHVARDNILPLVSKQQLETFKNI